jgi:hypothetical protein
MIMLNMLSYANYVMVTDQLLLSVSVPFTYVNMPQKCTMYMHKDIGYFMQGWAGQTRQLQNIKCSAICQ